MAALAAGDDAQRHFDAWCDANGHGGEAPAATAAVLPAAVLSAYLETVGFPRTDEADHLIEALCRSAGRPGGLRTRAEYTAVFLPAFRAALESLRHQQAAHDTDTDESDGEHGDTTAARRGRVPQRRRRRPSGAPASLTEIQALVGGVSINSEFAEEYANRAAASGESKSSAAGPIPDARGCIPNPVPQAPHQLRVGGMLNLQCVEPAAWQSDKSLQRAWSYAEPELFRVRGPAYMRDNIKVPSVFSIYEPVSMDIFPTGKRWFCTADAFWMSRVPVEKEINGMPTRLSIEITFPAFAAENAMFGTQRKNGPSHVWLATFVLSEAAKRQLRGEEPISAGVKLAREFCSQDDPLHGHFKTIFQMDNHDDPAVGSALGMITKGLLRTYNGKPYLSNVSHRVVRVRYPSFCFWFVLHL